MTFLVLLLIASVLLNLLLAGSWMMSDAVTSHGVITNTLHSGAEDQEIAILPLEGVISDQTRARFEHFMDRADEDKNIKAMVIDVDSPGGEVTPSDEIYSRIVRYRSEHPTVPVAVSMRSMATSGAYYAACGAEHLVAEQTSVTGSIGVLWPRFNFHDLMQKWGVKDATIVSSGTPFKDAGSPYDASDPQREKYLQALVDHAYARFKAVVNKSRAGKLTTPIDDIANGKAYTAQEAKATGLIDEIGYLDKALAWTEAKAGLSKPTIIRYEEKVSFMDRFPFAQAQGRPRAQSLNVNGIDVQIDSETIDRLLNTRPMYLFRAR